MLPLATLSLGLWVIAVDPAFIAGYQSIKNSGIWIDQLDHLPAVMTTSFFLIFSGHPLDKLRANLPHLQYLVNNFVYSSHRHQTVHVLPLKTHDSHYPWNSLVSQSTLLFWLFFTPPTPLIIPHRLPAFFESLMPLKNSCSIHARWSKSSLKHSVRFCSIFPSFKQNFIAYHSSKVSSHSDCIFEIHQQWKSGFSRVYSNCCCSCSFKPEIIKIGQSFYKMYSNKILNFQESTTILNAYTKVWILIDGMWSKLSWILHPDPLVPTVIVPIITSSNKTI